MVHSVIVELHPIVLSSRSSYDTSPVPCFVQISQIENLKISFLLSDSDYYG